MNKILLIFLSIFFNTFAYSAPPGMAGTLSLIPGLGQVSNGNYLEGLAWFSTIGALYLNKSDRSRQIAYDLHQYNIYDAYRDAENRKSTFIGDYMSNYNPLNAFDMIGTPILLLGSTQSKGSKIDGELILEMSFVGLGEEGLYRGALFPGLSSVFGSKWTGAIVSSALFAAIHLDGTGKIPFRFFMGMLFCWQADRNKYDLSNNIFAHSWFDVLVSSGDKSKINGFNYTYKIDF